MPAKKLTLFAILALALLSCENREATFIVTAKNFPPNTVMQLNDWETGDMITTQNITSKFTFKVYNSHERYASILLTGPKINTHFLIAIQPGTLKIDLNNNKRTYPVSATSEKGKELMLYYKNMESISHAVKDSADAANLKFEQANRGNFDARLENSKKWDDRLDGIQLEIIRDFARANPSYTSIPVLLANIGQIEIHPQDYRNIMALTTTEVKESPAGATLLKDIDGLLTVSEGSVIPGIVGKTPQGEEFNAAKVLKKLNVVICWMSYNHLIRSNHALFLKLYKQYKNRGVEFIGVSLDKNRKYWTDIIKADGLVWPQYSDLLGAKSPNARLSNMSIPYLFIIDKNKKILRADIQPDGLDFEISELLRKLP